MPTIGAGKHGYPENIVLNIIKEEVERISSMYNTQICLKNVSVIVFKEEKSTSISSDAPLLETMTQSPDEYRDHIGTVDEIQLHFVGSKNDVDNAVSEVKSFVESNRDEKTIENVGDILQKHWSEVESISNALFIKCPPTGGLTVQGMKDDVTGFLLKFSELQKEYELEEQRTMWRSVILQYVQWYYLSAGNWKPYDCSVNEKMESAYQDEKLQEFEIVIGEETYYVDFLSMAMKSFKTGQWFDVARNFCGNDALGMLYV